MIPTTARQDFESRGYYVARGLFSPDEARSFVDHYMEIHSRGGDGWAEGGIQADDPDPLRRYPRLMQPHRGDDKSFRYMVDPRIREWLTELLGLEPYAVQTMVYFKPPGARGQALHQDQRYLRVEPGTCVAAWLALDPCDEENGCLNVVPGSQDLPVICPVPCDRDVSFTTETVPVPPGLSPEMVPMNAGDIVFFNGSLIHGSPPNRSNRFRRIVVGHYIVGDAKAVGGYYHPVYRMDGSIVELDVTESDTPCGVFVDLGDEKQFQIVGTVEEALRAH
jgi:phytanoyl-CoA hydroxylase